MNMTLFEATTLHLYRAEEYPGQVPDIINKMSNWELLQTISEALDDVLVQYQDRRLIQRRLAPVETLESRVATLEARFAMTSLPKRTPVHQD